MIIVACPVPYNNTYSGDEQWAAREAAYLAEVKKELIAKGYKGKNTGKVISFSVGDGVAKYMLAEGRRSALIHLPCGHGYHYPDVQFLPKKEILARIAQQKVDFVLALDLYRKASDASRCASSAGRVATCATCCWFDPDFVPVENCDDPAEALGLCRYPRTSLPLSEQGIPSERRPVAPHEQGCPVHSAA